MSLGSQSTLREPSCSAQTSGFHESVGPGVGGPWQLEMWEVGIRGVGLGSSFTKCPQEKQKRLSWGGGGCWIGERKRVVGQLKSGCRGVEAAKPAAVQSGGIVWAIRPVRGSLGCRWKGDAGSEMLWVSLLHPRLHQVRREKPKGSL